MESPGVDSSSTKRASISRAVHTAAHAAGVPLLYLMAGFFGQPAAGRRPSARVMPSNDAFGLLAEPGAEAALRSFENRQR